MRFYPTKIHIAFVCLILTSISLNLGCSKDNDLLLDSVIEEASILTIEERDGDTTTEVEEQSTEVTTEEITAETFESRSTSFSPSNDAHVQSGKGYNQNIIRLEENFRTSYLMFDLSPIVAVGGTILNATLQITINSDDGNGSISVYKGVSNDWTEESLSESNAPGVDILIGELIKEFKIGTTEVIELDATNMLPEVSTLVLSHKDGNDLAFASKEHVSKIGPKLVVTYSVPAGSEEISIIEEVLTTEETTVENAPNDEPIAIADATPSSGGVPLEVTFTGSNSSDDSKVDSFVWDFKDGSSASTPNPTHTYTAVGVYEVELTIKDEQGLSSTDIVTITVTEDANEAPNAVVTATPVSGEAPLEVSFKGSDSTDDHSISTYGWDFKDGSKTNVADFTYTYTTPGTYEAELTVIDENGLSDKKTITISVLESTNEAPVAVATANKSSGPAPLEVQFLGDKSTDDTGVTSYTWDFKDGATASTANPSHSFTSAGTYNVTLTVKDAEGLSSQNAITITVTEPQQNQSPIANVSANPTSGQAPLLVQFLGNTSTDDKVITSYLWNFKDGVTATNINPSHTYSSAGTYVVDLTVKDAEGASSTKSVTITVTEPSVGNSPPGYYVATNGNASNNGQSPSSPWSLEHAFFKAAAGDIFYVKAGDYGNKNLVLYNSGNSSNPIKFIGYTSTPGDVISNQGSTFKYGDALNKNKMPLLKGNSTLTGLALDINGSYVEIHNMQITNYGIGVSTKGRNVLLKNVIVTNNGEQNNNNSQTGKGFQIHGDYTVVENCFNLNSNAQGINIKGGNNCTIKKTNVFSDNFANPGGYYIAVTFGGSNNVIEDCLIYRDKNADKHRGHGFILKDKATNNVIRRSKAYNTGIEVNFSGVSNNTFEDIQIYGSASEDSGEFSSGIRIINGAHDNTFQNIYIEDSRYPFNFHDFNDGFSAPDGDRDLAQGGNNNKFINVVTEKSNSIVLCNTLDTPVGQSTSSGNTWTNCTFSNVLSTPFFTSHITSNFKFDNCTFKNMSGTKLSETENGKGSWNASYPNSTFTNVNFPIPPH